MAFSNTLVPLIEASIHTRPHTPYVTRLENDYGIKPIFKKSQNQPERANEKKKGQKGAEIEYSYIYFG